jgi:alpha-glucosidase
VNGDEKSMTIEQSWQGLFTPSYDTYNIRLIGLPFSPKTVLRDGKKVKDFAIDEKTGLFEIVVFKSFKKLEILG